MLTHPLDEKQIHKVNSINQSVWNILNGRYTADIVSTTKANADNGDIWIIATGNVARIQFKANGHVYTITPDGW